MAMTFAALLRASSLALYGKESPADLARDLGVGERNVRRWLAGVEPSEPLGVVDDLIGIVADRQNDLLGTKRDLQNWRNARGGP